MKESNYAVKHLIKQINFLRSLKTSLPIKTLLRLKSIDQCAAKYIFDHVECETLQDLIDLYDKSKNEIIYKPRLSKKAIKIFKNLEENKSVYWTCGDRVYKQRLYEKLSAKLFTRIYNEGEGEK